MLRCIAILVSLLSSMYCYGQTDSIQVNALRFTEENWNFGRIEEADGQVSHTFSFTNNADHAVAIERVYSSCGCTTTDYTRRSVKAGGSGTFTVAFDPEGRAGRFDKQVSIIYDQGRGQTVLTIKGSVNPRPRTVADDYPFALGGGIRADEIYKAFGHVGQGKTKSMTLTLINVSDTVRTIGLNWKERSGVLEVKAPERLAAGEKGVVTLTYNLRRKERYGILTDRLAISVDSTELHQELSASAIAVDSFDKNARRKPKMEITPVFYNFGTADAPSRQNIEVVIANRGDAPLVIRSVESRQNTLLDLSAGVVIQPGEEVRTAMTLVIPADAFDTVFGGAIIVANDPQRPMRELRVSADIKRK